VSRLTWSAYPYRRELARPITTAHGTCRERAGLVLCVTNSDGLQGLGDAAPLIGFSPERFEDVQLAWKGMKDVCNDLDVPDSAGELGNCLADLTPVLASRPSLRFAIETALSDLAARREEIPLARWLSATARDSVAVNALVDASTSPEWLDRCSARWDEGYRTFKMKAGVGSVTQDIKRIGQLRDCLPEAAIRVDVNGGWTPAQFREAAPPLALLRLEFIEQPLRVGLAKEAHAIAADSGLCLALDEELATIGDVDRVLHEGLCDAIVVKPMVLGAIDGGMRLGRLASDSGVRLVFTSLWESDIGIAAACHLACALESETACGFSTAGMISHGIVRAGLRIETGRLRLPQTAGLGLELDASGSDQ